MSSSKRCSRCWETKSLDDFATNLKSPDKKQYTCRKCTAAYDKLRRKKTPRKKPGPKLEQQKLVVPAICLYDPDGMYTLRALPYSDFVATLFDQSLPDGSRWTASLVWRGSCSEWVVSGNQLLEVAGERVLIAAGNKNHPTLKEVVCKSYSTSGSC